MKPMSEYEIKDSGKRLAFDSGMVRDTAEGKLQYWRLLVGPMFKRWAAHVTKGAVKYPDVSPGVPNWTLAAGAEEYTRFRDSAFRHFVAYMDGEVDEDHAAGVIFNINGAEYVKEKMKCHTITLPEAPKKQAGESEEDLRWHFKMLQEAGWLGAGQASAKPSSTAPSFEKLVQESFPDLSDSEEQPGSKPPHSGLYGPIKKRK